MNYKGIAGSTEFERYKRLTKELHRVRIVEATREEKLSFFINIYNALVIHANVTVGPATNLWQRYKVMLHFHNHLFMLEWKYHVEYGEHNVYIMVMFVVANYR